MDAINVSLPAIDEQVIGQIETETRVTAATEVEAIAALRAKYSSLAKHAGYVRIGHAEAGKFRDKREADTHLEADGRRVRGLLAHSGFTSTSTGEFTGRYTGQRLYLLESDEWLELGRSGRWSSYEGSPDAWGAGCDPWAVLAIEGVTAELGVRRVVTDAQVAAEYKLAEVVAELGESLATLAKKLPERLTRVRQRAQLASGLLAELAKGEK